MSVLGTYEISPSCGAVSVAEGEAEVAFQDSVRAAFDPQRTSCSSSAEMQKAQA
jgi:hypothetical protein